MVTEERTATQIILLELKDFQQFLAESLVDFR